MATGGYEQAFRARRAFSGRALLQNTILVVCGVYFVVTSVQGAAAQEDATQRTSSQGAETHGAEPQDNPEFQPPTGPFKDKLDKALGSFYDWTRFQEDKDAFVQQGLEPVFGPPIADADLARSRLGDLPRFGSHPYLTPEFQRQLDLETDSVLTAGNLATLLPNQDAWETKRSLMREAQNTLYMSTMVLHCDKGGEDFVEEINAVARRGVDTRFIVDGIFLPTASPCLRKMREAGVKVAVSLRSLRPDRFDWEMHEKLLVVDGRTVITGGMNVGTIYQSNSGFDTNYRDTDILLEGPIVSQIARRFVELWTELRPEDDSLAPYLIDLDLADQAYRAQGLLGEEHYGDWLLPGNRKGLCRFVAQDPHKGTYYVWTAYLRYLEAAQARVMLTAYALNPEGSPTQDAFYEELVRLAGSPGGQVDIITNGPFFGNAETVNPWISRVRTSTILERSYDSLGLTPVRLWTYHAFMHAKQYYFDGVAVGIGSFNYDASGNRCQEDAVIVIDPQLVQEVEMQFALDLANSRLLSGERVAGEVLDGPAQDPLWRKDSNGHSRSDGKVARRKEERASKDARRHALESAVPDVGAEIPPIESLPE